MLLRLGLLRLVVDESLDQVSLAVIKDEELLLLLMVMVVLMVGQDPTVVSLVVTALDYHLATDSSCLLISRR